MSGSQEKQCWWEKALYSPLFPASQCEGKHLCLLELTCCCTHIRMKCSLLWIRIAADELDLLSVFKKPTPLSFHKKISNLRENWDASVALVVDL